MSRRVSPSTDQVYGLQRVTRIWGVSRATVYRHRHQPEAIERRRPGPLGAMADEELVRAIRQLLQDSPFHGEGYRKLCGQRSCPSPRSRLPVREPPLPERDPLPRPRKLASFRAGTRGQWLRRALHPRAEGKPAVGPTLRHGRGAAPGADRVQADLQPQLDRRAARLPNPSPGPSRPAWSDAHGRVSADRCLKTVDRYSPQRCGRPGAPLPQPRCRTTGRG